MVKKAFFKASVFSVLLLFCIYAAGLVVQPKRINVQPDVTVKVNGFYNEKKDSLDVVFCGTSKIFCLINPNQLWEEYGFTSYDFATNEQPIWVTYYYIKELLKYQKPDLIVLDTYFAVYGDETLSEAVLRAALDDLKPSINKFQAAWDNDDHSTIASYMFPLFRYHDRWSELTKDDYAYIGYNQKNSLRGFSPMYVVNPQPVPDVKEVDSIGTIPERAEEYLQKILDLLKEENIPILLLNTPYSATQEEQENFNYVSEYAEKNNVLFLDCNKHIDEMNMNFETDYFDLVHTNVQGTEKVTSFVGKYMQENFDLPDNRGNSDYSEWEDSLAYWKSYNKEMLPTLGSKEAAEEWRGMTFE